MFKYVNKGHDKVTTSFYASGKDGNSAKLVDETKMYYDCRYLSSYETAWRIFCFDVNYKEPAVECLNFHLPNEQVVIFDDDDSIDDVLNKPNIQKTKFLAWMDANRIYKEAVSFTYSQFPLKSVWKNGEHQWFP